MPAANPSTDIHVRFDIEEQDGNGHVRLQIAWRQSMFSQVPLAFAEYVLQPAELKQLARAAVKAVEELR